MQPPVDGLRRIEVQGEKRPRHRHRVVKSVEDREAQPWQRIVRLQRPREVDRVTRSQVFEQRYDGRAPIEHLLLELLFALADEEGLARRRRALFPGAIGRLPPNRELVNPQPLRRRLEINFHLPERLHRRDRQRSPHHAMRRGLRGDVVLLVEEEERDAVFRRGSKRPVGFARHHPTRGRRDTPIGIGDGDNPPDRHAVKSPSCRGQVKRS